GAVVLLLRAEDDAGGGAPGEHGRAVHLQRDDGGLPGGQRAGAPDLPRGRPETAGRAPGLQPEARRQLHLGGPAEAAPADHPRGPERDAGGGTGAAVAGGAAGGGRDRGTGAAVPGAGAGPGGAGGGTAELLGAGHQAAAGDGQGPGGGSAR